MRIIPPIMKTALTASVAVTILAMIIGCAGKEPPGVADKNLLVIVPHGFGINYYLVQDVWDQYGWHATYAGLTDSVEVCGPFAAPRGGMAMVVDTLLTEITDVSGYDALVLLTSTQFSEDDPFADIMESEHAMNLIASAAKNDIPVFTSCAGVRILAALDLIRGKSVTGSNRYRAEFEAAGATFLGVDPAPQILGNLITSSRGQYNNVPNGVALSTVIERNDRVRPSTPADSVLTGELSLPAEDAIWARTYGGRSADGAQAVCRTSDGGFLIVGYTFSVGHGNADLFVIKTDVSGNMTWAVPHGLGGTEYGYACTEVDDGYLVTGYTTSTKGDATDKDVYLVKIDFDGDLLWTQTYGGPGTDVGTALCTLTDGYAVCGFTDSQGAGETDIYLIKTDFNGEEIWSKTFGGQFTDMGNAVLAADDGSLIVGATTNSFGDGNSDFYVIKTDAEGNQLWANAYHRTGEHGHGFDWGNAMCSAPDAGYFLVGYSDCDDLMNAFVVKIDSTGDQQWVKSFGRDYYDYGNDVLASSDGGVYVCGTTKQPFNDNDFYLARLDGNGNVVWDKKIGASGTEWASAMCLTPSGDCVLVGHTNSAGSGSLDVCMVKVDVP